MKRISHNRQTIDVLLIKIYKIAVLPFCLFNFYFLFFKISIAFDFATVCVAFSCIYRNLLLLLIFFFFGVFNCSATFSINILNYYRMKHITNKKQKSVSRLNAQDANTNVKHTDIIKRENHYHRLHLRTRDRESCTE